jgi:predicted O-linked N-acetylglucosamine transferase (SPINDLY family)
VSEREIIAAQSFPRSELNIPENSLVFGTFGRIEKCISDEYLYALVLILQKIPNAYLVLAGPGSREHVTYVQNTLNAGGVGNRFRYLGQRQKDVPRLLKSLDIYCEPYPWSGGQSLMEAMLASLPVIAMRRKVDLNLDPTGCAPTTAVAEEFLGDVVPLANASDITGYVEIALDFARNEQYRKEKGHMLHKRLLRIASWEGLMGNFASLLRETVSANSKSIIV